MFIKIRLTFICKYYKYFSLTFSFFKILIKIDRNCPGMTIFQRCSNNSRKCNKRLHELFSLKRVYIKFLFDFPMPIKNLKSSSRGLLKDYLYYSLVSKMVNKKLPTDIGKVSSSDV